MPLVIYGREGRHTHPHETRNQAHAWPACAWFKKLAVEVLINGLPLSEFSTVKILCYTIFHLFLKMMILFSKNSIFQLILASRVKNES